MRILLLLMVGLVGCSTACSDMPIDNSPVWSDNNRLSGELINDCNSTTYSVGISGCAFTADNLGGNLTLPALLPGDIYASSYSCKNFSTPTNAKNNNVFQIADIYTNSLKQSCSWTIIRSLYNSENRADNVIKSRFFIKILPSNPYYNKLSFSVKEYKFLGVGWINTKNNSPEAITFYPTGKKGLLRIMCGNDLVQSINYTSSPVQIAFNYPESCDLEISATNSDNPKIDLGTLIYEVAGQTVDITPPVVRIKNKEIKFEFMDRDASGKKPVVIGVKINSKLCQNTNSCSVPHSQNIYTVKALTPSARLFVGSYDVRTGKWRVY